MIEFNYIGISNACQSAETLVQFRVQLHVSPCKVQTVEAYSPQGQLQSILHGYRLVQRDSMYVCMYVCMYQVHCCDSRIISRLSKKLHDRAVTNFSDVQHCYH